MSEIQTTLITYSNHLFFNDRRLAFKKQLLFDITDSTPVYIPYTNGYWLIGRKQLTILAAKQLIINQPISVDIAHLQMYQQCHLEECFNLN